MEIASTILRHLGGNIFIAMTGAKNFVSDGNSLRFKVSKCKNGINYIVITLAADDTYTVCFNKIIKQTNIKEIIRHDSVYVDNLQSVFTQETGLYTRI